MSLDFSAFLNAAEQQTRRVRAWRTAGIVLSGLGLLCFALAGSLKLAGLHLSVAAAIGLVAVALTVAIGAYVFAYTRPVRVPKLLLHLDERLELDERLSALYELRSRGGESIFRRRLEARLSFGSLDWKAALPLSSISIVVLSVGLLLLAGTLGVAAWNPPGRAPEESPVAATPSESEGSAGSDASSPQETTPGDMESFAELEAQQPGDALDPDTIPPEDFSLSDVLADLQLRETTDAVVGDVPETDLRDLAEQQAEAARRLSEMLESIRKRIQEEGGGLTQQEQEQLRQAMSSASPQMQQALSDLLEETDPDSVQEALSQLLSGSPQGDGAGDEQESTLAAVPDDGDDPFDDSQPDGESEDGEGESGSDQPEEGSGMAGSPGDEDGDGEESQSLRPGGEDESEGGDQGAAGTSGSGADDEAGFIRETVEGSIGDTGEITEFITAGVPLESLPVDGNAAASTSVSFELIRSILESRDLPLEARDAVRAYFEAISQGGS